MFPVGRRCGEFPLFSNGLWLAIGLLAAHLDPSQMASALRLRCQCSGRGFGLRHEPGLRYDSFGTSRALDTTGPRN